jgi:hypothetical protein
MGFTITQRTFRDALSDGLARFRNLPSAMLMTVAVIYLLPWSGVLGSDTLDLLYGADIHGGNLFIAGLLIFGALVPSWRLAAYVGGFIPVAYGLHLAWTHGGQQPLGVRVSGADALALTCLVVGLVAHIRSQGQS